MNTHNEFEQRFNEALKASHYEPLPGHQDRFRTKMEARQRHKKTRRVVLFRYSVLAAASVLLVVTIAFLLKPSGDSASVQAPVKGLSDISYEHARMVRFFEDKLQSPRLSGLDDTDAEVRRFLDENRRLEGQYQVLENMLIKNPSSEKLVDAMISNFKFRLQILESLQQYQKIKNNLKTEADENTVDL